jgi:hypothetical protein
MSHFAQYKPQTEMPYFPISLEPSPFRLYSLVEMRVTRQYVLQLAIGMENGFLTKTDILSQRLVARKKEDRAARSLIERQDLDSSFFYVIVAYIIFSTRKSRGQFDAETERSGTESVSIDNEYGGRGAAPI